MQAVNYILRVLFLTYLKGIIAGSLDAVIRNLS